DGDGKADADIAAGRRDDRGVDADKLAVCRHQGAARVAGIDRGVGLDEVFIAFDVQSAAAQRADDAGGNGLAEPERIADGDYAVADAQTRRVAQPQGGQVGRIDPEQSDVGRLVAADQLSGEAAAILQRDRDLARAVDDMVVGENVTLVRVDDDAGPGAHAGPLLRHLRQVEEASEVGIVEERVGPGRRAGRDRDVHHRGRDLLQHVRQRTLYTHA